eukprot:scaffold336_cov250-Pinguiococcus_pyrenoidosus.AAC.30
MGAAEPVAGEAALAREVSCSMPQTAPRLIEESDKLLNVLRSREAQILHLEERLRDAETNNALLNKLNNQKHDKLTKLTKRKNEIQSELLDVRAKLKGREGRGASVHQTQENRDPGSDNARASGKGIAGRVVHRLQREKEAMAAENRRLAIELENLRTRIRNQQRSEKSNDSA